MYWLIFEVGGLRKYVGTGGGISAFVILFTVTGSVDGGPVNFGAEHPSRVMEQSKTQN